MSPARPHPLPPVQAWCYTCNGFRNYRLPLPPLKHPTPTVTMREGICASCGGVLWRVGGGRAAEGHTETTTPDAQQTLPEPPDSC
jgi:hypothetical protein